MSILAYLSNTPDVLLPVLGRETEVFVQTETDVVAIESVGLETKVEEVLLERNGDGGLARGRKTSEPDGGALLLAKIGALSAGQTRVPCDVAVAFVRICECECVGLSSCNGRSRGRGGAGREYFVQQAGRTHVAIAAVGVELLEKVECKDVVITRV